MFWEKNENPSVKFFTLPFINVFIKITYYIINLWEEYFEKKIFILNFNHVLHFYFVSKCARNR